MKTRPATLRLSASQNRGALGAGGIGGRDALDGSLDAPRDRDQQCGDLLLGFAGHAVAANVCNNTHFHRTNDVAPTEHAKYLAILDMYAPLLARLPPEAKEEVLKGNYARLFDAARVKVRA